jgi:hypothetical protein
MHGTVLKAATHTAGDVAVAPHSRSLLPAPTRPSDGRKSRRSRLDKPRWRTSLARPCRQFGPRRLGRMGRGRQPAPPGPARRDARSAPSAEADYRLMNDCQAAMPPAPTVADIMGAVAQRTTSPKAPICAGEAVVEHVWSPSREHCVSMSARQRVVLQHEPVGQICATAAAHVPVIGKVSSALMRWLRRKPRGWGRGLRVRLPSEAECGLAERSSQSLVGDARSRCRSCATQARHEPMACSPPFGPSGGSSVCASVAVGL